jgi:hypothetical protein
VSLRPCLGEDFLRFHLLLWHTVPEVSGLRCASFWSHVWILEHLVLLGLLHPLVLN